MSKRGTAKRYTIRSGGELRTGLGGGALGRSAPKPTRRIPTSRKR